MELRILAESAELEKAKLASQAAIASRIEFAALAETTPELSATMWKELVKKAIHREEGGGQCKFVKDPDTDSAKVNARSRLLLALAATERYLRGILRKK